MSQTYKINTLHRRKYMLCFFGLILLFGAIASQLPLKEIYKIVFVLFTIPITLFIAVKYSLNPSEWTIDDSTLSINFPNKSIKIEVNDIDNIQSLTRSGGNLYVIHMKKKKTQRFWRNKLFVGNDDQTELQETLNNHTVEYYKM